MSLVTRTYMLLAISAICSVAAPARAEELLQNAGFDAGTESIAYGTLGTGWQPAGRPDLDGSIYSVEPRDIGGTCQRITAGNLGQEAGIAQRVTGLMPGRQVTCSGYVRHGAYNCTVWMGLDLDNSVAVGALPARTRTLPYNDGQWNRFELKATVGPSGSIGVYVWSYHEHSAAAWLEVDSVSLVYDQGRIEDLAVTTALSDALGLRWTAPPGATAYDIRYAAQPITEANWALAAPLLAQWVPAPATAGSTQTAWIRGLAPNTTCSFAIKFKNPSGLWLDLSNSPTGVTQVQGYAPYWAWKSKEKLTQWYDEVMTDCRAADLNSGSTAGDPNNKLKWYFGGWDPDTEHQVGIGSLLTIVRDQWLLSFLGKLADHVWDLTFVNWPLDKNHYNNTWPHEKIPGWNESHHAGECSWNGVAMAFHDYDNPKWMERLTQYAAQLYGWTGMTGNPPHRHFKSFWMKAADCNCAVVRGPNCQVDNPENRRFTRALCYAAWRDPAALMPNGQTIKAFLRDLDTAQADDAMKTDLGKPVGLLPGEIRFDNHQIGGYSGQWWRMAGSHGGTVGGSDEWWYDWRWGFVQSRDAYWGLIDQWLESGYANCMSSVRETLRYFSVNVAINNIPPAYMYDPPTYPWPDYNEPWGNYQYIINALYRAVTHDAQFDAYWIGHANLLWQKLPPPGAVRYSTMARSTTAWDTSGSTGEFTAKQPFFVAWMCTKDKEWLCRALDEMAWVDPVWMELLYNGIPTLSLVRLPHQPLTWNNTEGFTNFAAMVLDWDEHHVRWLTYNFDPAPKTMPIWLWSLQPGNYVLRHGPDFDLNDEMDSVEGSTSFNYAQRRTQVEIVMPSNRMEVFEIVAESCADAPDTDGDGVHGACDLCPGTAVGASVDTSGCPAVFSGDMDRDGDIDQSDFGHLQACISGAFIAQPKAECRNTDFDGDEDVDQDDLARLQQCFSGAGSAADVHCIQ